jgi:hypothetical protein
MAKGLVGHAGAILLRNPADVTGLTSLLSGALEEKGKSPLLDRGTVLVLTAAAIAMICGVPTMIQVRTLDLPPPAQTARGLGFPPGAQPSCVVIVCHSWVSGRRDRA